MVINITTEKYKFKSVRSKSSFPAKETETIFIQTYGGHQVTDVDKKTMCSACPNGMKKVTGLTECSIQGIRSIGKKSKTPREIRVFCEHGNTETWQVRSDSSWFG